VRSSSSEAARSASEGADVISFDEYRELTSDSCAMCQLPVGLVEVELEADQQVVCLSCFVARTPFGRWASSQVWHD
jgi:hypothetical protein